MANNGAGAAAAGQQADWASRSTQVVESFVELVRDKSLRPALTALTLLTVGLIVVALATAILVLGAIGIVRLLTVDAFGGRVWAADLVVGGLFTVAGVVLFGLGRRITKADSHV